MKVWVVPRLLSPQRSDMELVIRLKGGSGSGNFGHAGRPGEVGGSIPGGGYSFQVDTFSDYYTKFPDRQREGHRPPTDQELETFKKGVTNLPSELQVLRPPRERIILDVAEGRAENYGTSIYLDEKYLRGSGQGWGMTLEHEFLHATVNGNKKIQQGLNRNQYKPPVFYRHTIHYDRDMYAKLSEQLVMNLTVFDSDRNVWRDNISQIENYHHQMSDSEVQTQMDAVDSFLKEIGLW